MSTPSSPRKKRLGEILLDAGVIDQLQLNAALAEQRKWGGKLGRTLVEMGFVDESSMVTALSRQLGLPMVDLDSAQLPNEVVQLLRLDVAERYGVFPIGGDPRQKVLQLAMSDPSNVEWLQELSFATGMRVQPSVAAASAIERAIRRYYYGESTTSSETATPDRFGVSEPTFEPGLNPGASGGPGPDVDQQLSDIATRLDNLEKLMTSQVRALRGLLELLVTKGLVSREEYLARIRGRNDGPGS